jgi:hypothetical protein
MQFLVLTRRDPNTDFRRALVEALRDEGHDSFVVLVRKTLIIEGPRANSPTLRLSPFKFLGFARALVKNDATVIIDSLNLGDPLICLLLKGLLRPSRWAYDIHDHFLYDLQGSRKWLAWISLKVHLAISDFTFHAAPSLKTLFPASMRLGNASHLVRRKETVENRSQILILASVDERFDFNLVRDILAAGKVELHIHGSLAYGSSPRTQTMVKAAFEALQRDFPNLIYHGPYLNENIEGILDGYQIMLAPYKINDPSTRYIEPLRFYHALNRGLEVISTAIPGVAGLADCIHVIDSAASFLTVLDRLTNDTTRWRNDGKRYRPVTWNDRARAMVAIAEDKFASPAAAKTLSGRSTGL